MAAPRPFDADPTSPSDRDRGVTGRIVVYVQGNGFPLNVQPPVLIIDGNQMRTRTYGVNEAEVWPGDHRVELYSQSMRRYGFAETTVDVPPGGTVELFYAVPALMYYNRGNLGTEPQRHPGVAAFIAQAAVTLAIAALVVVWVR